MFVVTIKSTAVFYNLIKYSIDWCFALLWVYIGILRRWWSGGSVDTSVRALRDQASRASGKCRGLFFDDRRPRSNWSLSSKKSRLVQWIYNVLLLQCAWNSMAEKKIHTASARLKSFDPEKSSFTQWYRDDASMANLSVKVTLAHHAEWHRIKGNPETYNWDNSTLKYTHIYIYTFRPYTFNAMSICYFHLSPPLFSLFWASFLSLFFIFYLLHTIASYTCKHL